MSVDGKYQGELQTTLGVQPFVVVIKTDGNYLSGTMDGTFGQQSFDNGIVNGNDIGWTVNIRSPFGAMKLDVKGSVDGDLIEGMVTLGTFRPTPFKGNRC